MKIRENGMPRIGEKVTFSRTLIKERINLFTELNGDQNGIHWSQVLAQEEGFRDVVVPGFFYASFIATAMWQLGGEGTLLRNMQLTFLKPVYVGDTVTVSAEVTEIKEPLPGKRHARCVLQITIKNQNQENVIEPTTAVMYSPAREIPVLHTEPI